MWGCCQIRGCQKDRKTKERISDCTSCNMGAKAVDYRFLQIDMDDEKKRGFENHIWESMIAIVKYVYTMNGLQNVDGEIPVLLLREDRRYMAGNYSGSLGLFLN